MSDPTTVDGAILRSRWPLPDPEQAESKHDRGSIAVLGGASSTPGAVLLAGLAALRVGAGRLTIATTETTASALAIEVPEAAVIALRETGAGALGGKAVDDAVEAAADADAVLIGSGMRDAEAAHDFVDGVLSRLNPDQLVVLDALAITCGVMTAVEKQEHPAARLVVTPNDTEAEFLLDESDHSATEASRATAIAERYGVVVALGSTVAESGGVSWQVRKGNSGLGTSGSGDVLAGAVAGLLARGCDRGAAALWALMAHSSAGDRLAKKVAPVGFLARELLDELPATLMN